MTLFTFFHEETASTDDDDDDDEGLEERGWLLDSTTGFLLITMLRALPVSNWTH